MLKLENIKKTFNPGTVNEKCALQGLSLHLKPGDFATIIGSNGAGKSTMMNAIAGVFYVDEGSITLDGQDITGKNTRITGDRRIIDEMIYNLCDNAIKYNKVGGRVDLKIFDDDEKINLSVSDTGIGIPPQSQDRVFERFYRVDKSRSKAEGGTGLGLSIVKHAAMYHNAAVSLQSEVDKGTTVTVSFKK